MPSKVSIAELSSLLSSFDNAIRSIMKEQSPEIELEDDYIALVEIGNRSLSLRTELKKYKSIAKAAFLILASAGTEGNIADLPNPAQTGLKRISNFNTKWDCRASFGYVTEGQFREIKSFAKVAFERQKYFTEDRTFYGELKKIGGDTPKAHILSLNGSYINASLDKELASRSKELLYEEVKVTGKARYNSKTLKLTSYTITAIEPYNTLSVKQSINAIRKARG